MQLNRKADYKFIIPNPSMPEFKGGDLTPRAGGPLRMETICHLYEKDAEIHAVFHDLGADGSDYRFTWPPSWPYGLIGIQLGRCPVMWEEYDEAQGKTSASSGIIGINNRSFDGVCRQRTLAYTLTYELSASDAAATAEVGQAAFAAREGVKTGDYVFTAESDGEDGILWVLDGVAVYPPSYGITLEGSFFEGDSLTIHYSGTYPPIPEAVQALSGIHTASQVLNLFPSSAQFPVQQYDYETHQSTTLPYRRFADYSAGEPSLYAPGWSVGSTISPEISDVIMNALCAAYSLGRFGLTKADCAYMDFSYVMRNAGDTGYLSELFSASQGQYMLALAVLGLYDDYFPYGFSDCFDLLWETPRFAYHTAVCVINKNASVPTAGTGFTICSSYEQFRYASNPYVPYGTEYVTVIGYPYSVQAAQDTVTGQGSAVLDGLNATLLAKYPSYQESNGSSADKSGAARVMVGAVHRYFPNLSTYPVPQITPPGGDLAANVFMNSRITPAAIIYADNLLAECTRFMVFEGLSMSSKNKQVYDKDGFVQESRSTSTDFLSLTAEWYYSARRVWDRTSFNEQYPDGYHDYGSGPVQNYSNFAMAYLSNFPWGPTQVSTERRDMELIQGDAYINLGNTRVDASTYKSCVFGLDFTVTMSSNQNVDETLYAVSKPVQTSQVIQGVTIIYTHFEGVRPLSYSDNMMGARVKDSDHNNLSVTFHRWLAGTVEEESEGGVKVRNRVKFTLPSVSEVLSWANAAASEAGVSGSPFSTFISLYAAQDVNSVFSDFRSAVDGLKTEVDGSTPNKVYVGGGSGLSASASLSGQLTCTIKIGSPRPMFVQIEPRTGTLANDA